MVQRTISAARSHAARSAPGHAAIWVAIAAMPSWASPKPAPGTVWRSGTISAAGSRSPGTWSFRHCRNSSAAADSRPDTHSCPRFCGYYERSSLHEVTGGGAGGNPRWRLRWQIKLELVDQEPEFRLRLG